MDTEKAIRDHITECLHRVEVIKENMNSMALDKEACEHNIAIMKENIRALEAYLEYEKIGTVAEFRELKERDTKKPLTELNACPNCGRYIGDDIRPYCHSCGQRLELED